MRKTRPRPAAWEKPGTARKDELETARNPGLPALRADLWICLALFVATFAVYAQVRQFDFVNFDDPEYVGANPHVRHGITLPAVEWALTSGEAANWFPVTRLSHLLDCQFFGLASGWHHLTNVLVHALATVLLFAFLRRSTGSRWPSAWVAFLFALHPLHVESVAWIAERKDVLCAFFWFLALSAYVRYVERPGLRRYLLVLVAFGLGLMAKPMIVSLPLVLLLMDIWPLGRVRGENLLWEKLPMFALSVVSAAVTFLVQRASGAVEALPVSLDTRVANALDSYVVYIAKMFWPGGLAVFYPYPASIRAWEPLLAAMAIAAISILVLRPLGRFPYLAVGWLWYLVTLLPVIGLVQVGSQARADRYMYVPMVGLLMMFAWGARELVHRWPQTRPLAAALAVLTSLAAVPVTWAQVETWRNSESLFEHALAVTDGNYLAHHNLGVALSSVPGRLPDAIAHYQAALQIEPNAANVQTDYGNALVKSGRIPEAIAHYQAALRVLPDSPITHNDLANALAANSASMPEAIAEYQTALRLKPDYEEARNNLAQVRSNAAAMQYNLGVDLAKSGKPGAAIPHFEEALRLKPDYVDAHNNLGVVLAGAGRVKEAISHFEEALRIDPNSADAHVNLGIALSGIPGRMPEAVRHFEAALSLKPDPQIQQMLDRLEKQR